MVDNECPPGVLALITEIMARDYPGVEYTVEREVDDATPTPGWYAKTTNGRLIRVYTE